MIFCIRVVIVVKVYGVYVVIGVRQVQIISFGCICLCQFLYDFDCFFVVKDSGVYFVFVILVNFVQVVIDIG